MNTFIVLEGQEGSEISEKPPLSLTRKFKYYLLVIRFVSFLVISEQMMATLPTISSRFWVKLDKRFQNSFRMVESALTHLAVVAPMEDKIFEKAKRR